MGLLGNNMPCAIAEIAAKFASTLANSRLQQHQQHHFETLGQVRRRQHKMHSENDYET